MLVFVCVCAYVSVCACMCVRQSVSWSVCICVYVYVCGFEMKELSNQIKSDGKILFLFDILRPTIRLFTLLTLNDIQSFAS